MTQHDGNAGVRLQQRHNGKQVLELFLVTHGSAAQVHLRLTRVIAGMQVSDSFPFKWINKKWKEGFYVTSMATSHTRWAVVMSRNAGFVDQCVELDFQYPSEGIHRRWDAGGEAHGSSPPS